MKRSLLIILLILTADQIFKFWIKTNMYIGQEIPVLGDWFILHFTENNGMAFGMEFAGEKGKLFLSIFRLAAIAAIGFYLYTLIQKKAKTGLILAITLIFTGALGNIIDSAFYGMLFSASSYHSIATFLPEGGGYSSFLHGKVVDMLYFPVIKGTVPSWSPLWADQPFIFFRPVFNIADSAITTGVAILIFFQKSFFGK